MASKQSNNLSAMLAEADKSRGFPPGTMASVMKQESGGNSKFLDDPAAYHYGLNEKGRRIAGHTGKVSTAFGPFGILESTGADPGYGVAPLKDKSIGEQVRFAADYLAARSKGKGLSVGLAGYGEGDKYSAQVMSRIPQGAVTPAPIQLAQASQNVPEVLPQAAPMVQLAATEQPIPQQVLPAEPDPWTTFQQGMPRPVQVADIQYGDVAPQSAYRKFLAAEVAQQEEPMQPNFQSFGRWAGKA